MNFFSCSIKLIEFCAQWFVLQHFVDNLHKQYFIKSTQLHNITVAECVLGMWGGIWDWVFPEMIVSLICIQRQIKLLFKASPNISQNDLGIRYHKLTLWFCQSLGWFNVEAHKNEYSWRLGTVQEPFQNLLWTPSIELQENGTQAEAGCERLSVSAMSQTCAV